MKDLQLGYGKVVVCCETEEVKEEMRRKCERKLTESAPPTENRGEGYG